MVTRTRLLQRLGTELPPLTLVSAPAGFGKTTFVRGWIGARPHVWFSTGDHTTQVHKRHYLAISRTPSNAQASLIRETVPGNLHVLSLASAISEITGTPEARVPCVIDDYDPFEPEAPAEVLAESFLGRGIPLVLVSRKNLGMLSRHCFYGTAVPITASDLALTFRETREMLGHLPVATASHIWQLTKGWPAICAYISTLTDREALGIKRRTSPGPLDEYISSEVLNPLARKLVAASSSCDYILLSQKER